jgi:hypothetical protein
VKQLHKRIRRWYVKRRARWWTVQIVGRGKWQRYLCRAITERQACVKVWKRHGWTGEHAAWLWAVDPIYHAKPDLVVRISRECGAKWMNS